ncbi:exonuclease domain-containing protein [Kitasatospora viridis]|uniref:DNA polymerase-3 subunit epsilon n=1 Tax=Kitasatospora viridis TaxID=281105 RepID=A0A561UKR2_9ACTN|nr:exonuclease domain-containing protein [Kitasatospora viridis]TWF99952.1 DNA polymerase-3 subunit epsilon [Kitasatospora viridis]
MSWHTGRMAAFDLETTGVDVEEDRLITGAVVEVGGGQRAVTQAWMCNPGLPIPRAATKVHHITDAQARVAPPAAEVVPRIAQAIVAQARAGRPLIVMNAPFDLTLLDRELRRHGLPSLAEQLGDTDLHVIDPLLIDRQLDRYRKGARTLTDLCAHYGVTIERAHTADGDALAAARLVGAVARWFPQLQRWSVEYLHWQQVEWARQQAPGRQEYLRRRNPSAVVSGDWPLIPRTRTGGGR